MSDNLLYHVVDFLLPAQKFNIQYSFVTQQRLPFIREFVLRLVHVAPMSKEQVATYFGMSELEINEAISDLQEREELTISKDGLLILTNKSQNYFSDSGDTPLLSTIEDGSTTICFDLVTFSCFRDEELQADWKAGLKLNATNNNIANSEMMVEKQFQIQFHQILEKKHLTININSKENPSIYTVNTVTKLRNLPLRLQVEFKIDKNGNDVVREDFKQLNTSESVHELMTIDLSKRKKTDNSKEILEVMKELNDKLSINIYQESEIRVSPSFLTDEYISTERINIIGPIYAKDNWNKLEKIISGINGIRSTSRLDFGGSKFIWIAPSDSFWGKSYQFRLSLNSFLSGSQTNKKPLYKPTLYVPVSGINDKQGVKEWNRELKHHHVYVHGIKEGFLGGNVEILYLENDMVAVIYHISKPDNLPVSMPLGFISTNMEIVNNIGRIVNKYINGVSSHDQPNDCGPLDKLEKIW